MRAMPMPPRNWLVAVFRIHHLAAIYGREPTRDAQVSGFLMHPYFAELGSVGSHGVFHHFRWRARSCSTSRKSLFAPRRIAVYVAPEP